MRKSKPAIDRTTPHVIRQNRKMTAATLAREVDNDPVAADLVKAHLRGWINVAKRTGYRKGSPSRASVLGARQRLGLPIFHPDDEPLCVPVNSFLRGGEH